jgi:fission process protein 1
MSDIKIEDIKISEDLKTTDTVGRYAAYSRLLLRMSRYFAFTSDLGEAFRPVVPIGMVRATYGISWIYVIGDVCYEGKKEKEKGSNNNKVSLVMAERLTF